MRDLRASADDQYMLVVSNGLAMALHLAVQTAIDLSAFWTGLASSKALRLDLEISTLARVAS